MRLRLRFLTLAFSAALLVPVSAGSETSPVGGPPSQARPSNQPPPVPSHPPDTRTYNRPAIAADVFPRAALPNGYLVVDTVVSNTDPNLKNSDGFSDSEPSIAVNSANANQIAITGFSGSWFSTPAPIWYSTDVGLTWTKESSLPSPTGVSVTGCPCDQTIDYDRSSRLFGSVLNLSNNSGDIYTGDTTDPASAAAWRWFAPSGVAQRTDTLSGGVNNADQPWVRLNRDPVVAAQDNTYVAYGDFTLGTIQVAAAAGTAPPNFIRNASPGSMGCCVNPGARLANDPSNGTMYLLWQFATGINPNGSKAIKYSLNRSTDGGATWTLNGSTSGIVVANASSDQPTPKFGTVNALLGGVDTAAVDPITGDLYYVYGTKDSITGNNRLAVRRLTSNGQGGLTIGTEHFVTGQVQAALPSVAVADNGTVGVLYDTFDGFDPNGFPIFSAHLAQSTDQGTTFSDVTLVTFLSPSKDNLDTRQRVLGDYQQLRALGTTFYGVFTANGAAFGRSTANTDAVFVRAPALSNGDTTPPSVKAPKVAFSKKINLTNAPVKVSWSATDPSGVCSYDLQESVNGGPFASVLLRSPTSKSVVRNESFGTSYRYRVAATDCIGNASAYVAANAFTIDAVDDTSSAIVYTGVWLPFADSQAFGGGLTSSTIAGAKMSYTAQTTRVAWVAVKGPDRGQADISVDGGFVKTVDLVAASVAERQVIYQKAFTSLASHTLAVSNDGTIGRPRVDVDVILRMH